MNSTNTIIIGLDGGASKIRAGCVHRQTENTFELSTLTDRSYNTYHEFNPNFIPVNLQLQLSEFNQNRIKPMADETNQSRAYIQAFADVIEDIVKTTGAASVLLGLGLPGLKTTDKRGIAVMANGPRMPEFSSLLERELTQRNIHLTQPISHLGSDADHCGIGEEYAAEGLFQDCSNAYYLGGGTGAADALKLKDALLPFDSAKDWIAKTWEMQNHKKISLEHYASANGIQTIYSQYSGIPTDKLKQDRVYADRILELAVRGESDAVNTYQDVSRYLAMLIFERMTTIYNGWKSSFEFVNDQRPELNPQHPYLGTALERIIFGQRLGNLFRQSQNTKVLWKPFLDELTNLIMTGEFLSEMKSHYLHDGKIKEDLFCISPLKAAPVLGAGITAYLTMADSK